MAFTTTTTFNSAVVTKPKIASTPLPNFVYKYVNSSDLSNGYILNYSNTVYDLSSIAITASNFITNGIYVPDGSYMRTPTITLTSPKFTIVASYYGGGGDRRLFAMVDPTSNRNIEFRLTTDFVSQRCFQWVAWNNQYYNGPGGIANTGPNGSAINPFLYVNYPSDKLIVIYNGTDFFVYSNANTGGTQIQMSSYTFTRSGDSVYCIIGATAIVNGTSAPISSWSGTATDAITSFRFYNYQFTSGQITSALSGTYPSGL